MEDKEERHKGRECIYCKKRFECEGKPDNRPCLRIEVENDGTGKG